MRNIASSSSSSASTPKWTYDVFLSFRGEDVRKSFVDFLYSALQQKGIYTFKDDEKLERGRSISPALLQAIKESRIAVIIFSENYATSSWCLDELAEIIDCKHVLGQTVLPVFYDVDPSVVRRQKGSFDRAFVKHEDEIEDKERIQKWRAALTEAASISGWDVPNTADGGEGVRKSFVNFLDSALQQKGIYTFKDDEKLERVRPISPALRQPIKDSRIAVIIFSENYATSSWCLDELAEIIDCNHKLGQIIPPVFYYVDPSVSRKQKGSFGKAFVKHEDEAEDKERVQKWRAALAEASSTSGWDVPKTANG